MTALLLQLDPAVIAAALLVWAWAGMRAGSLATARTPRELSRRTSRLLVGIALGVLAVLGRIALTLALAGAGWWFVQEKVVLGLPVVAIPALAVLVISVPRLVAVRRTARTLHGIEVLAPSLRQQAAHPLLGWPVQVTAFGAAAAEVVFFVVAYPATPGSAFAVLTGVGIAAAISWRRLVSRHRELGDTVVVPSRQSRLLRGAGILAGTTAFTIAAPIAALAVAAPAPPAHADAGHGALDFGGGSVTGPANGDIPVTFLRGRPAGEPVRTFTLTARHAAMTTASGESVNVLTYDGAVPGPTLRVTQGDFLEVTLRNADIEEGVTIHWHGYDVPNGEDGVPGVTQDPVRIGQEFTYRFRADQVGSYWYHSHQNSYRQVTRGLYGVLIVTPDAATPSTATPSTATPSTAVQSTAMPSAGMAEPVDIAVAYHRLDDGPVTVNGSDVDTRRDVVPGATVRLRLINCANTGNRFTLHGAHAAMVALDGTDVVGPQLVANPALRLTAGGRADLSFTMPSTPVRLDTGDGPGLILVPTGVTAQTVPADGDVTELDPLRYGQPGPTPFGAQSRFDRRFTLVLDEKLARLNGVPAFAYTVNGNAYPDIPTQVVQQGELVKFTFVGRGYQAHPIHPHGHHVLILSVNGVAPSGSPLWMDTFEVRPGDVVEVALKADNPGVWMDHCHDLRHAAEGMVFHLAYAGISSPFHPAGE